MKKGITKLFTLIVLFTSILLTNVTKIDAATGTMSVSTNKSTVVIGGTFNVTVTISANEPLGSWQYNLQYDSSKIKLVSGDANIAESIKDGSTKRKTYNYTFKVIAKGTSTISLAAYSLANYNEQYMTVSARSTKITGITQAELEASYSKNNNLSSLGVTGYELSPAFNKDVTEYSVTVPSDVEKITLAGGVEDGKASVSGLGEFDVSEGENKFDVVVTAENGSQKTYTVKVNVQDNNPIEVTVDGITHTVVKRASTLTAPNTFEATTVKINDIDVPAFKSNITGYTLVGLKTSDGSPSLFIYDEEKNTYTPYKEIKTEGIIIFPKKASVAPDYYKITKVTINGEELEAYQYDGVKDYYLVYGVNIQTGDEGFYQYDMKNNTITRYNDKIIKELTKKNENFLMIIIVLGVETLVLLLILLITLTKRNKTKRGKVTFKDLDRELGTDIKKEQKENKIKKEEQAKQEEIKKEQTKTEEKAQENKEKNEKKNKKK